MEKRINYEDYYVWQEREVRFDVSKNEISLRNGEKCLDTVNNIEDSKGNNGDVGIVMFTNLRIIWFCIDNFKLNLSIGYDCILASEVKPIMSKTSGESMALFIKVKFGNNRFEFVFNAVANANPVLFNTFTYVIKVYEHTRLYRDVKVKGFVTKERSLTKLNLETIHSRVKNTSLIVYNKNEELEVGPGEFLASNVRLIWFSSSIENHNCSIPWIDIKSLKFKENNKYGRLIAIETNKYFNSHLIVIRLGLTNDIFEKLFNELNTYHLNYLENPILGIWVERDNSGKIIDKVAENVIEGGNSISTNTTNDNNNNNVIENNKSNKDSSISNKKLNDNNNNNNSNEDYNKFHEDKQNRIYKKLMTEFPDEVEIIDTNFFNEQKSMLNYISTKQGGKFSNLRDIEYNLELGLACEKLPNGMTLEKIWKIES